MEDLFQREDAEGRLVVQTGQSVKALDCHGKKWYTKLLRYFNPGMNTIRFLFSVSLI